MLHTHTLQMAASEQKDQAWLKLLSSCQRSGVYIRGNVEGRDSLQRLLTAYFTGTHSSFGVRQSSKQFLCEPLSVEGLSRRQIIWQNTCGDINLLFNGTPFIVRGRAKIYECQHGPARSHERRKEKPGTNNEHGLERKSRLTYQGSMKSDCRAKLKVLRVDRFPDFAIDLDLTHRSAKALRKAKEQASGRLWKVLVLASSSEAAEGTEVVVEYPACCTAYCRCAQWALVDGGGSGGCSTEPASS